VLGISFDTIAENAHFAEKFDFPFRLLCDTDRKVGLAYGATDSTTEGYPKRIAYLVDPQGKITKVWEKVDVKTHADEVLAAVPGPA
jgi:peroxiredoxin Q/BCP